MTCNGCVAKVKSELLKTEGVQSADVQLESAQAVVTASRHILVADLQRALGTGKYSITETTQPVNITDAAEPENNSYYPIVLIFGYIAGVTSLIQFAKGAFNWMEWMDSFMAGFFLLFSFFKLLNLSAFAEGYSTYDIIARKARWYGFIYPFIELLLGIAYLISFRPMATNIVTLAVMGVSSVGVMQSLARKSNFQCACLGTIIKLPLSKVTLFEDLLMVAMSAAMLAFQL